MKNRIKTIRKSRGLTQADVAESLGLNLTNYNRLETGKTELTVSKMEKLAKILACNPVDLIFRVGEFRTVQVRGQVEAGAWSEAFEWEESQCYDVAIPDDPALRPYAIYGAETRGPSMNRRYPEGTVIVFTHMIETQETVRVGSRYVVEREGPDGLREATVKTLWKDEEESFWLLPDSDDPRHQQPIALNGDDGDTIRIIGRVVYSVHKEP